MLTIRPTGYACDQPGCTNASQASVDDLEALGWRIGGSDEDNPTDWCPDHRHLKP